MAATASVSYAANAITVTGTGYVVTEVRVLVAWSATGGKRRSLERYICPVVGGAITLVKPHHFTAGALVVKVLDVNATVLATATTLNI